MDTSKLLPLTERRQHLLDVAFLQQRAVGKNYCIVLKGKKKGVTQKLTVKVNGVDKHGVNYIDTDGLQRTILFEAIQKLIPEQ